MNIETADRLKQLPPYLFAKIDQMKQEVKGRGIDILDFGVGGLLTQCKNLLMPSIELFLSRPKKAGYITKTALFPTLKGGVFNMRFIRNARHF